MRASQTGRTTELALVEHSPLRRADPRTKLFLSTSASFVLMLPGPQLAVFVGIYLAFTLWARLMIPTITRLWRLKWILVILFLFDWWLIGLEHGAIICTRIMLLTGIFTLFFATTTTREFGLALERVGVPYRYAFSLSLAFQSLGILDDEWRAIREAQMSRGAYREKSSFRKIISQFGNLISLTVPAIVLTTKRAWSVTEAAYARGFDSPRRKPYLSLTFNWLDALLFAGMSLVIILLYWSV